jgi:PAS domain S-box-containing protein
MSKASTAPKKTTTSAPPPELDILFDFISDDTRPTFVLQHSTSTVIFRNHAFDTVVSDTPQTSTNWLNDLVNAVRDGAMLDVQKIEDLGTFASRVWSSRKIKKAWTAVFCVRLDYDNGPFEPHPDPLLSEPEHAHVHNEPPDALQPRPDVTPVQNKHSDDMSSYSHSTAASIVTTSQFEKPLEDLTVDWLLFPHPTSDPWFQFLNDHAWEETVLGPIQTWNPTLRQMYTTILASREPRVIYWGNDLCMLYNEPAKFVVGEMHPHPLGKPLGNVWGTAVLVEIIKMVHGGIKRGRPICQRDYELILTRYDDFPESCFFDLVFLPIPSPDGHFMGVLAEFTEITDKVLQRNRQEVSRELIESVSKVTALQDLWTAFVRTLERKSRDVSYALVYTRTNYSSPHDTATLKLEASCNIQSMGPDLPADVAAALEPSTNDVVVLQHRKKTLPPELAVSFPELGTVDTAYVLPIVSLDGRRLVAVVVLGLNPRRALNSSVRQFAESLRDLLFKSVAICSLPLEQREAQEFARTLSHQLETMTVKAEKSEQNFTRMLRDAPIGMCMHRTDGYPIYINDICLELLGMNRVNFFKAAEAGLAWRDAVHDEDLETVNRAWISAIDTGKPVSVEFRIKPSHSVGVRWLELSAQQRHDEEGNLEYLYVWLRNVSSRRQLAEQKLADAIDSKKRSEIFIDMYDADASEQDPCVIC